MTEPSSRYAHFDGLRGLAALVVLTTHTIASFWPRSVWGPPGQNPVLDALLLNTPCAVFTQAHAAVCLFFILSGFVLTKKYFVGPISLRMVSYDLAKRFLRLFLVAHPAAIGTAMLMCLGYYANAAAAKLTTCTWFGSLKDSMSWKGVARTVINPMAGLTGDVNPAGWTLTVEVWASYAIFCLVIIASQTCRKHRMIAYGLLFVLSRLSALSVENYGYLQFFVLGMACADAEHDLQALFSRAANAAPRPFAQILALLVVAALCAKPPATTGAIDAVMPNLATRIVSASLTGGWSALLAIVIFVLVMVGDVPQRLLASRTPAYLGRISVGLYLVHFPILLSLGSQLLLVLHDQVGLPLGSSKVIAAAVTIVTSIACGDLYSRAFDAPAVAISRAAVEWWQMHATEGNQQVVARR